MWMPRPVSCVLSALVIARVVKLAQAETSARWETEVAEAKRSLETELATNTNTSANRLKEIQDELRPMFATLPKGKDGNLGHQVVRYVLHRLFMKRHGWFIRGLEPSSTEPPPYMSSEWVPAYLQGLLEVRFGDSGIDLQELAALAATLEDLAHKEVLERLEAVYKGEMKPTTTTLQQKDIVHIVSSYAMLYIQIRGERFDDLTPEALWERRDAYMEKYEDMPQAEEWWMKLLQSHLDKAGPRGLDFPTTARVLDEFGQRFSEFNEHECQDLKGVLMSMENPQRAGAGRIRVEDYWAKERYSFWRFTEPLEKLRNYGLLDETIPGQPSVLVSNYVASRNNCLSSSSLYEVCCRNECEELMSQLEQQVAAPFAPAKQLANIVESLRSSTVAPRALSAALRQQLDEAASGLGGKGVQLHGRPFARWMHSAFPHECPFPHEAGTVPNPETPDEWIQEEVEDVPLENNATTLCGRDGCSQGSPRYGESDRVVDDATVVQPGSRTGRVSFVVCLSVLALLIAAFLVSFPGIRDVVRNSVLAFIPCAEGLLGTRPKDDVPTTFLVRDCLV